MSCFKFKIVVLFRKINKTSMRRLLCCLSGLRSRLLAARKWGGEGGGGGGEHKKSEKGGGGISSPLPLLPFVPSFAIAPIFARPKRQKMPRKGGKAYGNACCAGYCLSQCGVSIIELPFNTVHSQGIHA